MIERLISPAMMEAAKASPSRLLAFAEIETSTEWVRVHNGVGTRTYKEKEYLGLGEFAGVGKISESASSGSNRITLTLRLLDQSLLSEVMNNDLTGFDCYIHLVAFDEYRRVIDGADYVFDGEIVDLKIKRGDNSKHIPAIISLTVSDWMERWAQATDAAKTTDAAQQYLYPGDRFFDLVEVIASASLDSLPVKPPRQQYAQLVGKL